MAKSMILLAALLASPAAAVAPKAQKAHLLAHSGRTLETMPMVMFESDCNANSALNKQLKAKKAAFLQNEIPGAGLEKFTPFEKVLKDGFYLVDCVKDSLREFGDKHGNGHQSYNMGDISNVSIVHYTEVVPKEDREAMTHDVCFAFCRSVPDMGFFGIQNGRDCYCTPYYKAMESDSTECDAVCEGQSTHMCGGKVKSTIFGMHQCSNTAAKLAGLAERASAIFQPFDDTLSNLDYVQGANQNPAEMIQIIAGQMGDPIVSDLEQESKKYAGVIEKKLKAYQVVYDALDAAHGVAGGLKSADMAVFENAKKADDAVAALEQSIAASEDTAEEAMELLKASSPQKGEGAADAAAQYYPLMYFADKKYAEVPATCTGDMIGHPLADIYENECAIACDAQVSGAKKCVAYFYLPSGQCYLFSKLTKAISYGGCLPKEGEKVKAQQQTQQGQQFLQKTQPGPPIEVEVVCKLKLSAYEGTNISPDGKSAKAGKCPNCLKELTIRDMCPMGPEPPAIQEFQ